jgi:hypothetical protein
MWKIFLQGHLLSTAWDDALRVNEWLLLQRMGYVGSRATSSKTRCLVENLMEHYCPWMNTSACKLLIFCRLWNQIRIHFSFSHMWDFCWLLDPSWTLGRHTWLELGLGCNIIHFSTWKFHGPWLGTCFISCRVFAMLVCYIYCLFSL